MNASGPGQALASAAQRWRAMVEAEHEQSERARGPGPAPTDHWGNLAERYREDPRRPMEPTLRRLTELIAPHHTLMDVGAGAGRLALPLALHCQHVVAVEPSPAMFAGLTEEAARAGIHNVTTVPAAWQKAEVSPTDIVLCVNVLYTVPDVEEFVRKLEAHARERVLIILHVDHPQAQIYPFWQRVHGEERRPPPRLRQLMDLLWSMGIFPDLEMLPGRPPRGYEGREEARNQLRTRLYVEPGSSKEQLLEEALDELLVEADDGVIIRNAPPARPGLVTWRPGS